MANVYGVNYNKVNANPPVNVAPADQAGRIRSYYDEYTQGAADGNIGDIINMQPLPEGAKILGGKLLWGTGNTNETLKAGVVGSDAAFVAATAAATAGDVELKAHLLAGYKVPAGGIGVIVTNGTAAIKAAQKVALYLQYVID